MLVAGAVAAISSETVRAELEIAAVAARLERLSGEPSAAPIYVASTALLAAAGLPVTPLVFAGGAVFGTLYGGMLAYAGTLGGALLSFALARTLARDLVLHLLGPRLQPLEALLERHGFWTLFRMRYVPVPFALTNYAASLAGLPFSIYASSTAAALMPVTLLYTYFASSLVEAAEGERATVLRDLLIASLAVLALSFLPPRISAWRRRRAQTMPATPVRPPADR